MLNVTLNRNGSAPRQILCLGAHSDDLEIGCGGTIRQLVEADHDVHVHWIVFGASGERVSEAEQSAARFLQGAARQHVIVRSFRDGFFPYLGADIKQFFEELKGFCNPDVIFTHYRDDRHQDHRLISDLTWNTYRNHLILEYEIPKYDGDLGQPNVFVPLDAAACRRKAQWILEGFPTQRTRHWFTEDTFMALLRLRGVESGSPSGYAEGFFCRKTLLDVTAGI